MPARALRPDLPPVPERIAKLPVRRGYPVPWFVAWPDGEGDDKEPEFRAMDPRKLVLAVKQHRCWVCGQRLGSWLTFTVGPMCAVNRISAEPPSHTECAEWSAKACPFLSRPHMRRRTDEQFAAEARNAPGLMIERNPGVTLVWTTRGYRVVRAPRPAGGDGILFQIGEPRHVECYAEGRRATTDEVLHSVVTGLPRLLEAARQDAVAGLSMAPILALRDQVAVGLVMLGFPSEHAREIARTEIGGAL